MKLPPPSSIRSDIVAGLTTAVMLIPQAMAYAILAGLPPIVGLYAAAVPLFAYAAVGTSRDLAVGPVAMDSLLTAATIGVLAQSGTDRYLELAALLAVLTGLVQLSLGAVRGGFLVNFLSKPVVSGFTSAAALIIGASQLGLLLGLDLPRSSNVFRILSAVLARLGDTHTTTATLAVGTMLSLWALKRFAPKLPRALLVVVGGALLAGPLGLAAGGVKIVGSVPAGLPSPRLPAFSLEDASTLVAGAITIAFVAFMEGISISTKLAEKTRNRVNPNREFAALGLANLASGLFQGYPVAGGLSRTAVNADAGAKSKLAGIVTASTVVLTLAFFTGALEFVPKVVLGSIIAMAVSGLIDFKEPHRLWKMKRNDFWMLLATFSITLTFGIQQGIAGGVLLSLGLMIVRTTRPHMARLGRIPGTEVYRNVTRYKQAQEIPGVLIARPDAQLYFGNVTFLRDNLIRFEEESARPIRAVILEATGINQLDSSAESALRELLDGYEARGVRFVLAGVKGPVKDVMARSGLLQKLGETGVVFRVQDAVDMLNAEREGSASTQGQPSL